MRNTPSVCVKRMRHHYLTKAPDEASELKRSAPANKEHWRSKGRVGSKAEVLRKTYNKAPQVEK